jgi:hypothetical protein
LRLLASEFVDFIGMMVTRRANNTLVIKNGKKLVDAFGPTPHNAPRNAAEGYAKKDGYLAQLVRAQHS